MNLGVKKVTVEMADGRVIESDEFGVELVSVDFGAVEDMGNPRPYRSFVISGREIWTIKFLHTNPEAAAKYDRDHAV